jgi:hypothetical protein
MASRTAWQMHAEAGVPGYSVPKATSGNEATFALIAHIYVMIASRARRDTHL